MNDISNLAKGIWHFIEEHMIWIAIVLTSLLGYKIYTSNYYQRKFYVERYDKMLRSISLKLLYLSKNIEVSIFRLQMDKPLKPTTFGQDMPTMGFWQQLCCVNIDGYKWDESQAERIVHTETLEVIKAGLIKGFEEKTARVAEFTDHIDVETDAVKLGIHKRSKQARSGITIPLGYSKSRKTLYTCWIITSFKSKPWETDRKARVELMHIVRDIGKLLHSRTKDFIPYRLKPIDHE